MTDTPTNDPVSEVMLWIGQRISEIEGDRRNFDFLSERECRELRSLRVIRAAMSARSPVGWEDIASAPKDEMFIWARPNDRGGWGVGLAYNNVSKSYSDAYGSPDISKARLWHAMPEPPSADLLQKMAGVQPVQDSQ